MKKTIKEGMSKGKMAAIGGGVAALGAISAGAYYLLGPDAKVHQKKALALLSKMKKQVASEVKKAKSITVPIYNKTIDTVSKTYSTQYKAHSKDIQALAKKLKSEWKEVAKKVTKKAPAKKKKV